jgi:hypothetical protein
VIYTTLTLLHVTQPELHHRTFVLCSCIHLNKIMKTNQAKNFSSIGKAIEGKQIYSVDVTIGNVTSLGTVVIL